MKYQIELFLLALSFFSRIPVPASTPYSAERMNQAGRYFALVGMLLGLLCALVFYVASLLLPLNIALFVMMAWSLLLTGAFHEDGLTDMADGIGGGMSVEKRLSIMKDSRIGTYGASALIMALLGKFLLLNEMAAEPQFWLLIVIGYTLSRAVAASLIYDMPYVSDSDASKSKPLAERQSTQELAILLLSGLLPCLLLPLSTTLLIVGVLVLFRYGFKHWLLKRIGGFTGDCLGAAQQLAELLIYLLLIALGAHSL
ncbi:adenosylcobinamide-GDP ribazoletransferase [Vibrio sinaloensis]|uniref:adenosylcobinamide-GDP ribazoletransferase n=1 Tax=Photobacterium sp. (strain ATCC 43367) TaxID=379097 RepID=UPI002055ACC2|nr:adenosylcobinamide-GDP ribazoletransferase [Vibrio sinaloensis]UPQ86863.1 adenosylcobinamide-GDP ribazoletransferase [Vibrio sinaloensis]